MSVKRLFNDEWYFTKQPVNSSLEHIRKDEIQWSPISIPHDWLIFDSTNLYETSDGWYRKQFHIQELSSDQRSSLRFEGVYMNSTIYINSHSVFTWKYGYSTFEFDITDYLQLGCNEILVHVIHEAPNSRWYSGAGIYRNVWLNTYPNTHLVADGIYISTKQEADQWRVEIDTEVKVDDTNIPSPLSVRHCILDSNSKIIEETNTPILLSPDHNDVLHSVILAVSNPQLWDTQTPNLYYLQTQLLLDNKVIDEETQRFGFRTLGFNSKDGFFINGKSMKINGVCQHHDLGCLGAAVNKTALKRQLSILQEMGVNGIRTAHNMPAVELMDLADEMGILIVSEAFDMWERKKTEYDYARFFPEWADKDVASWVRRDRNHPSVIMWSIGNEIYDTHADERGQELTHLLRDMVLVHDPKGNAPITIGSNYMPWENAQKCADIVKLAGYNYAEKYYDAHHKAHPDWIIYGSETSSVVQSRGIYHFPLEKSLLSDDDEQCSSLGNSSTSWGAKSTEHCIIDDRDAKFSLGHFIWTGTDYIGEPTPYHTKNSYFGQIDTAGFKKDSFYIYQAEWTSYKDTPMIHIFPYWDFSEGQFIDVRVCSNAPKIELFFQDISQGIFHIDHAHGKQLLGNWKIPYTKGSLRAVAYDENDNIIAEDSKVSFQDAASIVLTADKLKLTANGQDLSFIEITMVDKDGNPVENANNRVHVSVEGAGKLVGLDNGDSTDYDQYKGTSRKLFSGKLLAVIASTFEPGTINLSVSSEGLESKKLTLQALPGEIVEGSSELMACRETHHSNEVPIRKIEIVSPAGTQLNKEKSTVNVHAILHPSNTTYNDIEWRVTNAAGSSSNIAKIEKNGTNVTLTALGDGIVYLRCATKNGADKIRLYSHLEFHITGLGEANINPYEFISSSIYTKGSDNLTNGNDRGIATPRDGVSYISFERIDFGDYGSDEITLPIFALDSSEFPIEIWEGIPGGESATMIDCVRYQKPSIWNVYQEETYKLPRRLKGITTLSFLLKRKIHIKGFIFKKLDKAFEKLSALDNNHIYGDTFTLTDNSIENIGNNVSIVFDHMDFGEKGCSKLILCGHSPLDKNTIQVHFSGENGDTKQLINFTFTESYSVKEFSLEQITGKQKVSFVFLPGCQFDFQWFQFQ